MRYPLLFPFALLVSAAALSPLPGADWPAWRGPDRTGVSAETGLLKTWPKAGPKLLWSSDKAGLGYAGLAIVGDVVYTMGARGNAEYVLALNTKGTETWATKIGSIFDFDSNQWSRGPNATPTVDGDLVYALASKGDLICVKKSDGEEVWRLNLPKDLAGEIDNTAPGGVEKFGWGYSWSPLVDGEKLILVPGGSKGLVAAVNKKTGKVLWRSKTVTDPATYSSPVVATIGGVKQYVYLVQTGVVSVAASDGSFLWRWIRDPKYPDVVATTPIIKDNLVYVSVGFPGGDCTLLKITSTGKKFSAEVVYAATKVLENNQGGVILFDKHVFGYHRERNWACQDFASGKIAWPKKTTRQAVKSGGLLAADGRLYILDVAGTVAMLEASPKAYKVLGSFTLPKESAKRKISGKVWTHPSLSNGKLYLRDQELIFCYQVK